MEIVSNGHYTVIPNGCREISMDIEVLDGSVSIQNEKDVSITSNGTTTVNPDEGYDVIKKVVVETNVPSSGGANIQPAESVDITSNGEYSYYPTTGYDGLAGIDVNVNVPTSGSNDPVDIVYYRWYNEEPIEIKPTTIIPADPSNIYNCPADHFILYKGGSTKAVFFTAVVGSSSNVQTYRYYIFPLQTKLLTFLDKDKNEVLSIAITPSTITTEFFIVTQEDSSPRLTVSAFNV